MSAEESATCPNTYDVDIAGTGASTTGTIYGVYDMSGGAFDRVMGNFNHMSGYTAIEYTAEQAKNILGRTDNISIGILNSGFNGPVYGKALDGVTDLEYTSGIPFPNEKYYDLYISIDKNIACNGKKCMGDGTTETSGWYGAYASFVFSMNSWFYRGGSVASTKKIGVFSSDVSYGYKYYAHTFRVVLSAA